ncbi:hypothetical protein Back11_19940 [Paenibacillus baekrokdamisoli]|uniref:Uncharacterized protein n=1 Tax=Paenibacillus baekrokdamisoli TaxID=1712516 RepID=A0A3G9JCG9_9BACL|nr:hypothetical protein [Paenibacillus baekrokdamisoli]MBB3070001.1 hypothetical protein [Paenibacillus baekrokdamisoli]BBH20649.1 hypothetical protein Back11_19940 [Paenibacillus baekrokdamisoli]
MKGSVSNKRIFWLIVTLIAFILAGILAGCIYYFRTDNRMTSKDFNNQLAFDGIQLGMTEERLIQLWGEGEHIEGFGGHIKKYKSKQTAIGIAGDSDNDFYKGVTLLETSNKQYAIYGVHVGDSVKATYAKLAKFGYKPDFSGIYMNGEFVISLQGKETIETIQIWFNDKDLRDRVY